MSADIMIVDDEAEIADLVEVYLKNEGYTVHKFGCGRAALACVEQQHLDLAILDVMLPDLDGFALCQKIREKHLFPILMLTARVEDMDKITGLTLGADDYLTKPFHFEELEARIRSLTRRKFIQEDVCLRCSRITFDTRTREASVDGTPLALTRKESALLEYFLLHRNRIISPEEMIEHLWDGSVNSFSNSIRVHISSLRKKLRTALGYDPIQNKIGQGYIMED